MRTSGIRSLAAVLAAFLALVAPLAAQAPGSVESYLKEGRTAMEAKSYWMATIQFRQATSLAPDHAEAHFLLGASLASDGKWEEAKGYLERAVQLDPALQSRADGWLARAPGGPVHRGARVGAYVHVHGRKGVR